MDKNQELRSRWNSIKKEMTENKKQEIEILIKTHGLKMSAYSFYFVAHDIAALVAREGAQWNGLPYMDYKTYKGWNDSGFHVRRGEKSKISGIVWIGVKKDKESDENEFLFPKEYHLFAKCQVEPIQVKKAA